MNITEKIFQASLSYGSQPAVIDETASQSITYEDFGDLILSSAIGFAGIGIRKGSTVAVMLPNCTEYIISFFALIRLEAIIVPLKMGMGTRELDEIFANAGPSAVITVKEFLSEDHKKYLSKKKIILIGAGNEKDVYYFEDLLKPSNSTTMIRNPRPKETDIVSINYTYRGYGYPLGALLTHKTYLHGAEVLAEGLKPQGGQKLLLIIPLSHIFTLIGCVMVPLLRGMSVVLLNTLNVRKICAAIAKHGIHTMVAVPEVYTFICDNISKEANLDSLKVCVCGGSPLSADGYQYISRTLGVEVLHGYGLTEFTPVTRNMFGESKAGSMGPACAGLDLKIAGDGELLIKSEALCKGYHQREKETAEAWENGWFRTGDTVERDADGHYYFKGWKKKIVKVAGNMVDTEEVRNALLEIPGVADARCFLSLDGDLSAEVKTKKDLDGKIVKKALFAKLTPYKIPRNINFI